MFFEQANPSRGNEKTNKLDVAKNKEMAKPKVNRKKTKNEDNRKMNGEITTTPATAVDCNPDNAETIDKPSITVDGNKNEMDKDKSEKRPEMKKTAEEQQQENSADNVKTVKSSTQKVKRKTKTTDAVKKVNASLAVAVEPPKVSKSENIEENPDQKNDQSVTENVALEADTVTKDETIVVEQNNQKKTVAVAENNKTEAKSKEENDGSKPKKAKRRSRKEKTDSSKRNKEASTDDNKQSRSDAKDQQLQQPSSDKSDDDFDINQIINSRRNKKKPQTREVKKKYSPISRISPVTTTGLKETDLTAIEGKAVSGKKEINTALASDIPSKKRKSKSKNKTRPIIEKPDEANTLPTHAEEKILETSDKSSVVANDEALNPELTNNSASSSAAGKATKKASNKPSRNLQIREKKPSSIKNRKAVDEEKPEKEAQKLENKDAKVFTEDTFDKNEVMEALADSKQLFIDRPSPRFQQRYEKSNRYNNYTSNPRRGGFNNSRRPPRNFESPSRKNDKLAPKSEQSKNEGNGLEESGQKAEGDETTDVDAVKSQKPQNEKLRDERNFPVRPKRKTKNQRELKISTTYKSKTLPSVRLSTSSPVPSSTGRMGDEANGSEQMKEEKLDERKGDQQPPMETSTSEPSSLSRAPTNVNNEVQQPETQSSEKPEAASDKPKSEPEVHDKSSSAPALSYNDQPLPYHPAAPHAQQQQPSAPYYSQQQQHDYYYSQQQPAPPQPQHHSLTSVYPPHPAIVDYNMMIPIDPTTGMPATTPTPTAIYNYDPHTTYQMQIAAAAAAQQPYIPTVYYLSPEQQSYYNMQPHYTQLYDQEHYNNTTPYYQQYQQPVYPYNPNHGYRNNRGGRNSSNANNGVMTNSSSNNSNSSINNTNTSNRNTKGNTKQ
ncbi:hypothetical protein BDF20DRAFT_55422 [Mycotypha africana]|uniref:uncharacterized protein n=1 Tax=Mycotypha africana TaxID=64632 RepID=UPI002301BA24|nr:uncharacterized protein BDF20DRAFT_55422 [Mycotypha africana]KAI8991682.1 hypothetical protein BDF20DRAFT_55422 [Mycotypha africana]